jgi:predicted nucleic acid-binding protein
LQLEALVDDHNARREAERLELKVKGTIGILLAPARQNRISKSQAAELLEKIRGRPYIWIAESLVQAAVETITALQS